MYIFAGGVPLPAFPPLVSSLSNRLQSHLTSMTPGMEEIPEEDDNNSIITFDNNTLGDLAGDLHDSRGSLESNFSLKTEGVESEREITLQKELSQRDETIQELVGHLYDKMYRVYIVYDLSGVAQCIS